MGMPISSIAQGLTLRINYMSVCESCQWKRYQILLFVNYPQFGGRIFSQTAKCPGCHFTTTLVWGPTISTVPSSFASDMPI